VAGPSPPGYEKTGRLVAGVLCLAAALERGALRLLIFDITIV